MGLLCFIASYLIGALYESLHWTGYNLIFTWVSYDYPGKIYSDTRIVTLLRAILIRQSRNEGKSVVFKIHSNTSELSARFTPSLWHFWLL